MLSKNDTQKKSICCQYPKNSSDQLMMIPYIFSLSIFKLESMMIFLYVKNLFYVQKEWLKWLEELCLLGRVNFSGLLWKASREETEATAEDWTLAWIQDVYWNVNNCLIKATNICAGEKKIPAAYCLNVMGTWASYWDVTEWSLYNSVSRCAGTPHIQTFRP